MIQFCFLRLYVGIETVSCFLLLQKTRMDMDRNLEKLGQVLMLCLQKSTNWLVLPDETGLIFSLLCIWVTLSILGTFLVYGYPCVPS